MGETLIRTENLGISFGAHKAVNKVNLELEKNVFTTILGPNGAGKTTLFNLMSGLLKPTEGKIFFKGTDVTSLSPIDRVKMGMGRSFQLTNVFPSLTAYENVRLSMQARENVGYKIFTDHRKYSQLNEKTEEILERVLLKDKKDFKASELSHGEQRKLELGMVLALDPEVLLLDEPTAGMAIEEVPTMIDILQKTKKQGTTIILIEHKMDMVKTLSDKLIIIVNGMKLIEGDPEAVSKDPEVLKAYLGGGVLDDINS
ncbi:amino acid/amide ABC transporter ATP-binding protein 1, HAAT family [Proteiniborus ethanoligenes]|uniref:Amino acid/amide ABC transporter ATP-binding protein 1, HAAT family n=1 Tax=Proteiniborus ethanoligenes TaxID=415015 RepID=A0A1H3NUX0_9FIRM|nr:ABC transporter ATP-binding protein [Proteiniborus ethanoligenes]SDY91969.1 amino acid/amide ABC transporter ATP-binding protein 1, HAAT family [Proteiniborus ethanoligenes]